MTNYLQFLVADRTYCSFLTSFTKFWLQKSAQNGQFWQLFLLRWFYLEWQILYKRLSFYSLRWFGLALLWRDLLRPRPILFFKFATGLKTTTSFMLLCNVGLYKNIGPRHTTRYTSGQVEIFLAIYKNIYKCFFWFF